MKPPPTLARRLGLAIGGALTAAVIFVAGGSAGLDALLQLEMEGRLSPQVARAVEALEHDRPPALEDLAALMEFSKLEEPRLLIVGYGGLGLLSIIAIALGVMFGGRVARQLATSVNAVTEGAQRIAAGDFSHRIAEQPKQAREIQSLISSFNSQAEALDRSDRQLRFHTASVAHELRTPLTVLTGYIHGALDGVFPRDDDQMRALLTQVEDLSRIVDDLRTLSLASSGALSLQTGCCDLAVEAQAVLDMIGPRFEAAGITIKAALPPTLVEADPARVRQMLLAVLDNVHRYAAEGGCLSIRTERQAGVSSLLVADCGPGFPPQAEHLVFERFWRADLSRTRATGGSGLGLAVVKALADAHRGSVQASNRRGGGALIELSFPHQAGEPQPEIAKADV